MPPAWEEWLRTYIYTAVLMTATLEGMGLPVPAEALFVVGGQLVREGSASLPVLALTAAAGNLAGALTGYALARAGGAEALEALLRLLHVRPEAADRAQRLFHRYGPAAVFVARFIGIIRVPVLYMAGAMRMALWRFGLYTLGAALLWHFGWAWLALQFGAALPHLVRQVFRRWLPWLVGGGLALLAVRLLWRRFRRDEPVDF